jgi:hypothetical protein
MQPAPRRNLKMNLQETVVNPDRNMKNAVQSREYTLKAYGI